MFKAVCNIDPKMKFIPKWVMNFFVRKIGSYMLGKMIKLAKNIKGT
jgi:flagellar biosynthesis protein FliQ